MPDIETIKQNHKLPLDTESNIPSGLFERTGLIAQG